MLKYILLFISFLLPLTTSAYSLVTKVVDGHKVRVFVIPHDDVYHVSVSVSNTGTSLKNLVENRGAIAGMNGAYFIPKDYTGNADSTNTVRIMGGDGFSFSKYFPDTGINGIFGFLHDGKPLLIQNSIYGEKSLRDNYNSGMILEVHDGIANFPVLLASGANLVPRYDNIGLITDKMKVKSTKSFICRTKEDDVKMGTIEKISMLDVPDFIRVFGCIDAINLDNGGSLAMYEKGKYVVGPGRNIMDAFVIVKNN